jgi:hypothetical protein
VILYDLLDSYGENGVLQEIWEGNKCKNGSKFEKLRITNFRYPA